MSFLDMNLLGILLKLIVVAVPQYLPLWLKAVLSHHVVKL